jgi:hypothetical protein
LQQHDDVAMVMHWAPLERQVRVEGRAEMVSSAEADHYFHTCASAVCDHLPVSPCLLRDSSTSLPSHDLGCCVKRLLCLAGGW